MVFDVSLEGTEAQKNAQLAPAAPVPALDREVAESQGKRVGLEPIRSTNEEQPPKSNATVIQELSKKEESPVSPEAAPAPVYRAVSQDELMGYDDDFEDEDSDDDADYF